MRSTASLYTSGFNGSSPPLLSRQYRRAYAASVSYQDYNIGKILGAKHTRFKAFWSHLHTYAHAILV